MNTEQNQDPATHVEMDHWGRYYWWCDADADECDVDGLYYRNELEARDAAHQHERAHALWRSEEQAAEASYRWRQLAAAPGAIEAEEELT